MNPQVNKFRSGIDQDTSIHDMANTTVCDAVNMSMTDDRHVGDGCNIKGTEFCTLFYQKRIEDLRVVGSQETCGIINGKKKDGVLYFVYDSINKSAIFFFCKEEKKAYQIFPNPSDQDKDFLNFKDVEFLDSIAYSERDCCFVRWVDNVNIIRRIEVSNKDQSERSLSVRKMTSGKCPTFMGTETGGSLLAGGYQVAFRYYNKSDCSETCFSSFTNTIPVIVGDDACNPDNPDLDKIRGGKVGEFTDRKIKVNIPFEAGYDSVQALIIKHITCATEVPTSGYLTTPNEDWYSNQQIVISGNETGVQVDLADYVIDDLPIISAGTITNKDERDFLGNIKVRDFEMDNGDLSISKVCNIQQPIGRTGLSNAYKCEIDSVFRKSYMRGENYAFGVFIYDEFCNGIVCPIDTSVFNKDAICIKDVADYNLSTFNTDGYSILISNSLHEFQTGDVVLVANKTGRVTEVLGNEIRVIGEIPTIYQGKFDLKFGQKGNQGSSWSWKFPDRCDNQYTIFDENDNVTALGIRIEGLKNFPSWAKGFQIVRKKRVKDVLCQTVHIPTIGVRGSYLFDGADSNGEMDYDGELNTIQPKFMGLGHARNLYTFHTEPNSFVDWIFNAHWTPQIEKNGVYEISSLIFALCPEYLYQCGEESFNTEKLQGGFAKIVDAVAFQKYLKHSSKSTGISGDLATTNVFAHTYEAVNRANYFYNREGCILQNGTDTYLVKLEETEGFKEVCARLETAIEYCIPLANEHPKLVLPSAPMGGYYSEINNFGGIKELALQQRENLAIPASRDYLFQTVCGNSKGQLIKLQEQLEDFSRLMAQRKIEHNDDYFKLLNWIPKIETYTEEWLNEEFDGPVNSTITLPGKTGIVPSNDGDVISGAYILNITRGLGDDRYGDMSDESEWITTGVCQELTEEDIRINRGFDLDVFGGDIFITKHSLKVNDTTPRTAIVDPVDAELPVSINKVSKVGVFNKNVEIIDVYLESEINSSYERIVDKYPKVDELQLNNYAGPRSYEYHPGYSAENCVKTYVGKQEFCKEVDRFTSGVAWSDRHVRGGESNALSNIEGYDRYRVNNIWLLDGKYGKVVKVDTLEDKSLHIWQESKIAFQPIGVDEIRTVDGNIIATGTGSVIGSGDYYLQRDVGTQHPSSIQKRDGAFYGVDAERKVVYSFGNRGGGFRFISWEKMNTYFRERLSSPIDLSAFIDAESERYIVANNNEMIAYNMKFRYWETRYNFKPDSVSGNIWTNGNSIYRFGTGNYNEFFGKQELSEFEIVVNSNSDITKVLQAVQVNSNERLKDFKAWVYDSNIETGRRETEWISLNKRPRNQNEYHENLIRWINKGKKTKLRGRVFVLRFRFEGGKKVCISSIITKIRQSI